MRPQGFKNSEVYHWKSRYFLISPFLSTERTDELDVAIVKGHGECREYDGDSEYVAVVPEAEFGKFERSHNKFDALLLG